MKNNNSSKARFGLALKYSFTIAILSFFLSGQNAIAQNDANESESKVASSNASITGTNFIEKQSFQNRLVKFYLKLRNEKKFWQSSDIGDHLDKKREKDDFTPKQGIYKNCKHEILKIGESDVSILTPVDGCNEDLIIYFPGGAFILGPMKYQWSMANRISKNSQQTMWVVDYPKTPEHDLASIYQNVYAVYQEAIKKYPAEKITLLGGSSGGNIALSLAVRLKNENRTLPKQLVLLSPFIDFSSKNPEVEELLEVDPILAPPALIVIGKWLDIDTEHADPTISPIYNDLSELPPMYMFMASDDILMPDQKLFHQKALEEGAQIEVFYGNGMLHDWPVLPTKDGKMAVDQVIKILNQESAQPKSLSSVKK